MMGPDPRVKHGDGPHPNVMERGPAYRDEGAESQFAQGHRDVLMMVLDLAELVPALQLREVEEELREAREALKRFGDHDNDCDVHPGMPGIGRCDCGFDDALASIGGEQQQVEADSDPLGEWADHEGHNLDEDTNGYWRCADCGVRLPPLASDETHSVPPAGADVVETGPGVYGHVDYFDGESAAKGGTDQRRHG